MKVYPDFSKCTVLVVGDVMLDRYYWGKVSRISPEAPVPVVRLKEKSGTLGGAGNVALNIAGLNCRCILLGICGNDSPGKFLNSLLEGFDIENNLVNSPTRPTTTKTRVVGQGQQIVRIDEEETGLLADEVYSELLIRFEDCLPAADAVIISDYGKGIFEKNLALQIIERCKQTNVPVFVDPKGTSWERYEGATCITPNTLEFNQVAPFSVNDERSLKRQAKAVIERYGIEYLMVTRGGQGLSLFGRNQPDVHISAIAKEVFDVSGAGDTVIATLAAACGVGLEMNVAAEMANLAAGIVVGKVGTQPITAAELQAAFYGKGASGTNKIFTRRQAREIIAKWRSEGKDIVFTNGCFDILHVGHIKLLNAAAEKGDKLVVGLNSDASIRRLKGATRPVIQGEDRAAILASIKSVDMVVIFEEDTPVELIEAFQPDVIVKGGDYTAATVVGHELVEQKGGKVVIIPLMEGISTTRIIEKMKNNTDD